MKILADKICVLTVEDNSVYAILMPLRNKNALFGAA